MDSWRCRLRLCKKVTSINKNSPSDYGEVILTHISGALSHVSGAWAYPPPVFRTGFEIAGDGGLIQHDSEAESPIELLLQQEKGEAPDVGLPASPLAESPYDLEIADFYKCLQRGTEPLVCAEDGLAALKIASAAMESTRTGEVITLSSSSTLFNIHSDMDFKPYSPQKGGSI